MIQMSINAGLVKRDEPSVTEKCPVSYIWAMIQDNNRWTWTKFLGWGTLKKYIDLCFFFVKCFIYLFI